MHRTSKFLIRGKSNDVIAWKIGGTSVVKVVVTRGRFPGRGRQTRLDAGEIGNGEKDGEKWSPARVCAVLARWDGGDPEACPLFSVGVGRSARLNPNACVRSADGAKREFNARRLRCESHKRWARTTLSGLLASRHLLQAGVREAKNRV